MYVQSETWEIVQQIVEECGYTLFDLEVPRGRAGKLVVYLQSLNNAAISIDDCECVSRRISSHAQVDKLLPGNTTLEVSSPGVNRQLSRAEHFQGAVGERVRVQFRSGEGKAATVTGILEQVSDGSLCIADEGKKNTVEIALSDIEKARVDFLFG